MRDGILAENKIQEREIRLVGVVDGVAVWYERWGSANTMN